MALRAVVRRAVRILSLAGCAACFGVFTASAFAADHYSMDGLHSIPEFEFKHLGITTQTGRFDKARGAVTLDFATRTGSVSYEVEANSLDMGFGTESPESPGYQLFEVAKFPKIIFRSNELIFNRSGGVIAAKGQLTLLGVSKPIVVTVNHFRCSVNPINKKAMCAGEIAATVKRSEFGMVRYIPGISDEIDVRVPVEAYKD